AWEKINLPVRESRIADVSQKGDTLLVLTRHYLLKSTDGETFETIQLPAPVGYVRKTGLFDIFWQLHSGELWGLPGKLIVDLLGLVTILLSVTGVLHFFFPKIIKKRKKKQKQVSSLVSVKKKNLRWHNVVGYIFALFLLINTFSGMHLRPPLLIAIANKQVGIIPGTHLDSPNPWFDKLRRVLWDEASNSYIFSTSEGFYFADESLAKPLQPAFSQPPVSVMGCNVFQSLGNNIYLVGSFNGMFLWNIQTGAVADFFTRQPYAAPGGMQNPIGANMVAGLVEGDESAFWFDYNSGAKRITSSAGKPSFQFPEMPDEIVKAAPMSLWNVSLEIHTGRIFEHLVGPFYILYVPLAGICLLLVLISGVYLWWKLHRKKK
ncbi:MAG: PepSY domain-containing protein, partial [Prolixibacteraceae bacterium]|nr:PepSY domain-containing protein [Prolixibacteraceae bacterium]